MSPHRTDLLVVDDEADHRALLRRRLERHGYGVATAGTGDEAIAAVARQRFGLVLLDVEMPGMSGLEALRAIRATHSPVDLPVIMVTARRQSGQVVEALGLGASDYVTKPIDFAVAAARIRTQLSLSQADAALRLSEERYALAARGAHSGIWDWHLESGDVYFSGRWHAQLGYGDEARTSTIEAWFERVHPDDVAGLRAAVEAHLAGRSPHLEREHRMLHRDGSCRWMLARGIAVRDADGRATRMAGSLTDVTGGKITDALTGLPNRALFSDRLRGALDRARAAGTGGGAVAVLFVDLDRFRVVNESLGYSIGDQLLVAIARRLEACVSAEGGVLPGSRRHTIARLGGDEFTILLEDIGHAGEAVRVVERVEAALVEPFTLDGQDVFVGASIGIALSAAGHDDPETLVRDANTAMHRAKAAGAARYEIFDRDMRERAVARLRLESDLRRAVERQQLFLQFQPIASLDSGRVDGVEALVRWAHPERGVIAPAVFIPLAEDIGMIGPVGRWVLGEACRQGAAWRARLGAGVRFTINVNVSGLQMTPDLVAEVRQALAEAGLPPSWLKLEITESTVIADPAGVAAILGPLKQLGVRVALDDFGTGYSSLSSLHQLPIDTLKIDRSFVARIGGDGAELVRAIVAMAHGLGLDVTAEGIEHELQLERLKALGCEQVQGHLLSMPLDAGDIVATLGTDVAALRRLVSRRHCG